MSMFGPHPDDEEIFPPMSDLQMAFAQSQLEEATRERTPAEVENFDRIQAALAAGRFVVCATYLVHCRVTDAVLGSRLWYSEDFATAEEAQAHCSALIREDDCGEDFTVLFPSGSVPPAEVAGCPF